MGDADSDLELGIALSLSEQVADGAAAPALKIKRRRLLPPVIVGTRSKKLLRNVYRDNRKMKAKIDAIIDKTFHTLRVLGDSRDTNETLIDVEALELALMRLGYAVGRSQLQEMVSCYGEGRPPGAAAQLAELALYMRETVEDRNIESKWRPDGAVAVGSTIECINIDTFRELFLDCNLRIETNGLIY